MQNTTTPFKYGDPHPSKDDWTFLQYKKGVEKWESPQARASRQAKRLLKDRARAETARALKAAADPVVLERLFQYGDAHPTKAGYTFVRYRNRHGTENTPEWESPEAREFRKASRARVETNRRRRLGVGPFERKTPEHHKTVAKASYEERKAAGLCRQYAAEARARETPEDKAARLAAGKERYASDADARAKAKADTAARNILRKERMAADPEFAARVRAERLEYARSTRYPKNKVRLKEDPAYRLRRWAVGQNARFRKFAHLPTKQDASLDLLGCTVAELKAYLESKFKEGMSWDNAGSAWHIDHIQPLCSGKTEDEVRRLCHWSNLQPLWEAENRTKGGRW